MENARVFFRILILVTLSIKIGLRRRWTNRKFVNIQARQMIIVLFWFHVEPSEKHSNIYLVKGISLRDMNDSTVRMFSLLFAINFFLNLHFSYIEWFISFGFHFQFRRYATYFHFTVSLLIYCNNICTRINTEKNLKYSQHFCLNNVFSII